jgi:hypothetical protein
MVAITSVSASREAAKERSPRREPWVVRRKWFAGKGEAPEGRKKRVSHTSGNILLHFIFSTHGRQPLIKPDFRDDLFAYRGGIIREMRATTA